MLNSRQCINVMIHYAAFQNVFIMFFILPRQRRLCFYRHLLKLLILTEFGGKAAYGLEKNP